jgi:hypothetical protein
MGRTTWAAPSCGFLLVTAHDMINCQDHRIEVTRQDGIAYTPLARVHLTEHGPNGNVSMCVPVLAGRTYTVSQGFNLPTENGTSLELRVDAWFVPIVEAMGRLDPPIQLAEHVVHQAASDGILLCWVQDAKIDVLGGCLAAEPVGKPGVAGDFAEGVDVVAAADHDVSLVSPYSGGGGVDAFGE